MAKQRKFIKSTTYSIRLDDFVYCVIDRTLVPEDQYGNELRLLQHLYNAIDKVDTLSASIN